MSDEWRTDWNVRDVGSAIMAADLPSGVQLKAPLTHLLITDRELRLWNDYGGEVVATLGSGTNIDVNGLDYNEAAQP